MSVVVCWCEDTSKQDGSSSRTPAPRLIMMCPAQPEGTQRIDPSYITFTHTHTHSEHKAALDLARLYMAGNSTRKPPQQEEGEAEAGGGGARVTELTPAEARRARLKAKAEAQAQAARQQVAQEGVEEVAEDPVMAPHRFAGGGAFVKLIDGGCVCTWMSAV